LVVSKQYSTKNGPSDDGKFQVIKTLLMNLRCPLFTSFCLKKAGKKCNYSNDILK
jgi:hypothetical protein